jgi:Fe-Mn family superoxide dismutase
MSPDVARSQSPSKPVQPAPAYRGEHELVPLHFDPKKLRGISERLIVSHHENNYGAAVESLNKVEGELAKITAKTPPFVVAGLKERQLVFSNSCILHELYFRNLGGAGRPMGAVAQALADAYGSLARWEEEFRVTGASLAGGSGWVVLDFDLGSGALRTYWSGGHPFARAAAIPLLVMDMYEHAYQLDHGAAAMPYVNAFFENIEWEEVERRFTRAGNALVALRG